MELRNTGSGSAPIAYLQATGKKGAQVRAVVRFIPKVGKFRLIHVSESSDSTFDAIEKAPARAKPDKAADVADRGATPQG